MELLGTASLANRALRCITCATVLTAVFVGPTCAQQPTLAGHANNGCRSAISASTRLLCADQDLAAADSILTLAYQDSLNSASTEDQTLLAKEQQTWIRERNQKCGLIGKDRAPIGELLSAKQCLEDEIVARISDLRDNFQTGSISSSNSALGGQNIIITPVGSPADSNPSEFPAFQKLHFSAPATGVGGMIDCSAPPSQPVESSLANTPFSGKWIVRIAIDDDGNSYRMFENDTLSPFLDNLRVAVQAACADAIKSGRLKNTANESISELSDIFEVYSPQGLFRAYTTSQNTPWTLQTNLPKARSVVKSDLGIQTWIEPSQLARNPYFFKDSVVGMVIQFDHMLTDDQAVFERSGAEVFVSGVSPALFQHKELLVLAGRVTGNKGLVSPVGSEELLPALDYVGAYKCDNRCDGF